jgi:hypothetical protein
VFDRSQGEPFRKQRREETAVGNKRGRAKEERSEENRGTNTEKYKKQMHPFIYYLTAQSVGQAIFSAMIG